jgi:hypothetical protein
MGGGNGSTSNFVASIVALVTSFVYLFSFGGVGIALLLSHIGFEIIVLLSPIFMLLLMFQATRKRTLSLLIAGASLGLMNLIFIFLISLFVLVSSVMVALLGSLGSTVSSIGASLGPLAALFLISMLMKHYGLPSLMNPLSASRVGLSLASSQARSEAPDFLTPFSKKGTSSALRRAVSDSAVAKGAKYLTSKNIKDRNSKRNISTDRANDLIDKRKKDKTSVSKVLDDFGNPMPKKKKEERRSNRARKVEYKHGDTIDEVLSNMPYQGARKSNMSFDGAKPDRPFTTINSDAGQAPSFSAETPLSEEMIFNPFDMSKSKTLSTSKEGLGSEFFPTTSIANPVSSEFFPTEPILGIGDGSPTGNREVHNAEESPQPEGSQPQFEQFGQPQFEGSQPQFEQFGQPENQPSAGDYIDLLRENLSKEIKTVSWDKFQPNEKFFELPTSKQREYINQYIANTRETRRETIKKVLRVTGTTAGVGAAVVVGAPLAVGALAAFATAKVAGRQSYRAMEIYDWTKESKTRNVTNKVIAQVKSPTISPINFITSKVALFDEPKKSKELVDRDKTSTASNRSTKTDA